jgi:hypothetical protein
VHAAHPQKNAIASASSCKDAFLAPSLKHDKKRRFYQARMEKAQELTPHHGGIIVAEVYERSGTEKGFMGVARM